MNTPEKGPYLTPTRRRRQGEGSGRGTACSTRRVLLVSHEASRTGAPRVAVEVLRSLAPLRVRRIALLRWDGPLHADFGEHAEAVSLEPLRRTRVALRRRRRTRRTADRLEQVAAAVVILRYRPHVVYLNTVKAACYIRPAHLLRRPVVLHVHELEPLASQTLARYRLGGLYGGVHLVACSTEVGQNLSAITGSSADDVTVIPSTVDRPRIESLARLRSPHLLPAGSPRRILVGACGSADPRKGVDQWLSMARLVRDRARDLEVDVRFLWIGRPADDGLPDLLRQLELEDAVEFTGEVENPYPLIVRLDVFTHPARQDPFPLAVLEAMALSRPVVAFDVGGVSSQLGDTGILVPPGDVEAMAAAVIGLAVDPRSREALGARAAERVACQFSIERMHQASRSVVEALLDG